jgi:hypothetical protein
VCLHLSFIPSRCFCFRHVKHHGHVLLRTDLANVVIRKEVDMEDFFQRYDLDPLVKTENLEAGKRVLQKVSADTLSDAYVTRALPSEGGLCIVRYSGRIADADACAVESVLRLALPNASRVGSALFAFMKRHV